MRGRKSKEGADGKRKMFYFSFDNKEEMFIRSKLEEQRSEKESVCNIQKPKLGVYNSLLNIY